MRRLRALLVRLAGLFTRDAAGFDEELAAHLALHIDDNIRAGLSPEAARRDALLKLGGLAQTREAYRDRRRLPLFDQVAQDVRAAWRALSKSPGFALIVILTLGLGVGANAAIFSVVNAVLLRPLPYPESDRLVIVYSTNPKAGNLTDVLSFPEFEDWKAQNQSFTSIAAFTTRRVTVHGEGDAESVDGLQPTPGFFETLGVLPALGRTFQAGEEQPGTHVVILSDAAWHRYFGGRPDVIGQTLRINEDTHTVVGVMPPGSAFRADVPELLYTPQPRETNRGHGYLRVLARLRPGISRTQAQADMGVVARRISDEYRKTHTFADETGANVMPLLDAHVGVARTGLLIFMGVVALVLLIACTNVANLMLARNLSRQKELAVRAALGAGRRRLLQHLLTESLLLAIAGGGVGLLIASITAPLLAMLLSTPFTIPRLETTHTDAWVLGFTGLVSLATVVLFGGVHAQAAASADLQDALRVSTRSATEHVGARRMRRLLVLTQIAVALTLLAGAGALIRSLFVLYATPPGFSTDRVLAVDVFMPRRVYSEGAVRFPFLQQALAQVRAIHEVQAAAFVSDLPMGGGEDRLSFHIVGRPDPSGERGFGAQFNQAGADYFRTLSIPIRAGREFTDRDTASTPLVVVINDAAARRFWPGEDAVGARIALGGDQNVSRTVVGVVGDVRQRELGEAALPEIFLCDLQPGPGWPVTTLVARTSIDPAAVAARIRSAVQSADPEIPIWRVRTLDEVMGETLAQPRVYASLLAIFAALALLLAAIGLYGVMSYTVNQRLHEIGIRMALGAARADVIRLVLRQALVLAAIGTIVGLAGALAVARLLTHLIPSAQPTDPLTLAAVCALLLIAALAASYAPARRGSRVDPMITLRDSN